MRVPRLLACASLLLTLAACDAGRLDVTAPQEQARDAPKALQSTWPAITDCPAGWDCVYATDQGGVTANRSILRTNCNTEACGLSSISKGYEIIEDGGAELRDLMRGTCMDGSLFSLTSDATGCWDCTEGCAVEPECPAGERCVTIPKSAGSDCRRFKCEAGYTMYTETGGFLPPTCRRDLNSTATPPAAPAVAAYNDNGLATLTWAAVSGATEYHVYRQLEWMTAAERWYTTSATTYTDPYTSVVGFPQSGPTTVKWVGYYVVSVGPGGESGPSAFHFFEYTGLPPY